jgi:hypothetical protein
VRPQGLDIGPDSLKTFQDALSDSKTVIWNGPMGVFEFEKFAKGTYGVANTLAELTPKVRPSFQMMKYLACRFGLFTKLYDLHLAKSISIAEGCGAVCRPAMMSKWP